MSKSERENVVSVGRKTSTEEEDLVARSTKKVKTREEEVVAEDMPMVEETPLSDKVVETPMPDRVDATMGGDQKERHSYRDKLLNVNRVEEEEMILEAMKEAAGGDWDLNQGDSLDIGGGAPFNSCPSIDISLEEAEEWCRPWRQALIVNLHRKKIRFKVLQNRLVKDWSRKCLIKFIDISDEHFLVHFQAEEDYKFSLFEGPWMIQDHYLIVQRWRPFFRCDGEEVKKLAVWVRIPNLPIELCNTRFLWRIGSKLGTMLKVDMLTSVHSRARFARICVEIDLRRKFVPKFEVLGDEYPLEYKGFALGVGSMGT